MRQKPDGTNNFPPETGSDYGCQLAGDVRSHGGSFLRVRGSLTALDSEPPIAGKLKAVLSGILRFCGGRIRLRGGGEGTAQGRHARQRPQRSGPGPRQPPGPGGVGQNAIRA